MNEMELLRSALEGTIARQERGPAAIERADGKRRTLALEIDGNSASENNR